MYDHLTNIILQYSIFCTKREKKEKFSFFYLTYDFFYNIRVISDIFLNTGMIADHIEFVIEGACSRISAAERGFEI